MGVDVDTVIALVGDEFGLRDVDLAAMYGIEMSKLGKHLTTLGHSNKGVYERLLSDLDGVRVGYRQLEVQDEVVNKVRHLLADYIFHPLVPVYRAGGGNGWRLSSDDAQWVAYRTADVVGMDFDHSDVLRLRLQRVVVWPDETMPKLDQVFRDRVADVTFYLMELTGVL